MQKKTCEEHAKKKKKYLCYMFSGTTIEAQNDQKHTKSAIKKKKKKELNFCHDMWQHDAQVKMGIIEYNRNLHVALWEMHKKSLRC